jgi:hypothetical protein
MTMGNASFVLVRYRTVNSDSFPIIKVVMEDYQKEDWVSLYQSALIELEQAKMSGRISAAQKAIVARVEKLRTVPGLHTEERQAIEDALRGLNFLKREDARFDAEKERRAIEESLEKLRSVGKTIQRLRDRVDPE